MIQANEFVEALNAAGIDFFTGVPDSLLKSFCAYITDASSCSQDDNIHCSPSLSTFTSPLTHVIAANEGGAVGLAAGHYLATGRPALVYMQNSGQGNAVNPLCSLADPDVYSIPMVLLVGWRGEPGVHDEPQHVKQGKVTIPLFETLGIPTVVLTDDEVEVKGGGGQWRKQVSSLCERAVAESRPVALIVRKGLFAEYKLQNRKLDIADLPREQAIERILDQLPADAVIVSTTGMISRELYELREKRVGGESRSTMDVKDPLSTSTSSLLSSSPHSHDFLTVGSMGHASMIALGIAKAHPDRPVVCLDGDGASIMQMGNMAIVGQSGCGNLTHIVLNNAAHDSVGGQPTVGGAIDLKAIAAACGYEVREERERVGGESRSTMDGKDPLFTSTSSLLTHSPKFIEIRVAKGARKDLGRPKEPPQENKNLFMEVLRGEKVKVRGEGERWMSGFVREGEGAIQNAP